MADEILGACRRVADDVELLAVWTPRWLVEQEQLDRAEDRGEDVVEIVGDPTGEPAHGFDSLRVPQLLLQAPALAAPDRPLDGPGDGGDQARAAAPAPRAILSGVPWATTRPPASPAPGPMSMIQSARFTTSRWCSITSTVCPASTSRSSTRHKVRTSSKCRPVVGSSRM